MCVAVARHRFHPHVPRQALHRLTLHSATAATSSTFSTWAWGCASAAMAGGGAGGGGCASSPQRRQQEPRRQQGRRQRQLPRACW